MTPRALGLLPRKQETRRMYASQRKFIATDDRLYTVMQRVAWVQNQESKGSCVGQAYSSGVNSKLDQPPWCSALGIWVDARRRQGNIEGVHDGTRSEYAIESLQMRGWSPFHPGEDLRPSADDAKMPTQADEMFASDKKFADIKHFYCEGSNCIAQVVNALSMGLIVCFGTGVRDPYFAPPRNTILDSSFLGGNYNGHEQRVIGYLESEHCFIVVNSWGEEWSSCEVEGITLQGCCKIKPLVLEEAWDVDAISVRI